MHMFSQNRKRSTDQICCACIIPVSYTHLDVYKRQRDLARDVAKCYLEKREEMGFPLLSAETMGKDKKNPLQQADKEQEKRA